MTYNPDYSAALNQARSTSGALQGLGQKIGAIPEKMRQQEQQAQMQKIMGAAAQGDKEALNTLYSVNPDVAKQLEDRMYANQDRQQQGDDRLKSQIAMDTADAVERIAFAKSPEEATAMFNAYVDDERFDIDEEDRELFMMPEKQRAVIGAVKGEEYANSLFGGESSDNPAAVKETEWFLKQTPERQATHLKVKRKTNPTMAEKLEQKQAESDIKVDEAGRTTKEKGKAKRQQGFIDSGIEAADSLGNIKQSLELLNSVDTGGFDNAALRAKQFFGIESGDEAQLSAGLGKAILSQLKPIFGSAFTEAEGARLERIEANFGKSTEGNRRLLSEVQKITERAARRGLKAAKSAGDEFTAQEIQSALDALSGGDQVDDQVTQEQYNAMPAGTKYTINGVDYVKGQ